MSQTRSGLEYQISQALLDEVDNRRRLEEHHGDRRKRRTSVPPKAKPNRTVRPSSCEPVTHIRTSSVWAALMPGRQ